MNLLSLMSFVILAISIITMVFGIIAYFLYKARERKQQEKLESYDEALERKGEEYLFFTKEC